jgi:hypothetical protein
MGKEHKYPIRKEQELTEPTKAEIRDSVKRGASDVYKLAEKFGCSPSQIAGIKTAMTKLGS